MDAIECILTRRSIRKYENRNVPDELIRKILVAGMSAPSAGNEQPWQFVVITEKKILNEIPRVSPYAAGAKDASAAILVCGDLSLEQFQGLWVVDCSAATQNMLLAVHALGLGAVWTGVYPMQDRVDGFRELLHLPDNIIPLSLIPIGYPAQKMPQQNRYKKERVHYNKW